jgi:hypothetical protein
MKIGVIREISIDLIEDLVKEEIIEAIDQEIQILEAKKTLITYGKTNKIKRIIHDYIFEKKI